MSRGDDFLGRWSARKLQAREAERVEPAPAQPEPAAPPAPDLSERTDEEILEELGLPDPDTLWKGDDFSVFLQAAVPARLRNRALRRLWRSNPVLANLDGLNDYDGDFTDAATVVKGGVNTAYKIGRGLLRDEPEKTDAATPGETAPTSEEAAPETPVEALETAEAPEDETAVAETGTEGAPAETSPESGPTLPERTAPAENRVAAVGSGPAPDPEAHAGLRAARMRFRFDG